MPTLPCEFCENITSPKLPRFITPTAWRRTASARGSEGPTGLFKTGSQTSRHSGNARSTLILRRELPAVADPCQACERCPHVGLQRKAGVVHTLLLQITAVAQKGQEDPYLHRNRTCWGSGSCAKVRIESRRSPQVHRHPRWPMIRFKRCAAINFLQSSSATQSKPVVVAQNGAVRNK